LENEEKKASNKKTQMNTRRETLSEGKPFVCHVNIKKATKGGCEKSTVKGILGWVKTSGFTVEEKGKPIRVAPQKSSVQGRNP